jgi:hypothetical protein
VLNAILRRIDAIEDKMQPLQPLQDQVAILEATIQEHATQQQALDVAVTKVTDVQSA